LRWRISSATATVREAFVPKGLEEFAYDDFRAAQPRGTRVEVWDLGFASAYLFGAVCPSEGKAAALIMPICNTAAMNHDLSEISSQVAADTHAAVILDRAGWHRSQGLVSHSTISRLKA